MGLLASILTSCGVISDRSSEYMQAQPGQELQLPDGLSLVRPEPKYPIPEVENQRSLPVEFELPPPPDATAALKTSPYIIDSSENEVWLHLFNAPNDVWPLVELFWSQFNLDILNEDVRAGLLTTQKLDAKKGSQTLLKQFSKQDPQALVIEGMAFQTRAIHGVRRNTTEIQVRALLPDQEAAQLAWTPESINPRLERALLEMIGEFATSESVGSRHSLLAGAIGGESRVKLLENQWGDSYLELDLSMQRAWTELEQALVAAGIIVAEQSPENHKFYVSYLSLDDLENWYHTSNMVEERKRERNFSLQMFQREDGKIIVTVDKLNPDFDEDLDKQILNLVYEYIS